MSVVYVLTTLIPEDGDDATVEQLMKRAKTMRFLRGQIYGEDASSKKFLVSNFTNYKMIDSRLVMEQYNELLGILGRFTQHKINMDEVIQVSCIIDKLHPSWKDFKHALKHLKEELTRVKLGSHLRIEKSLRVQDSDKPKGNNVVGPLVVNMMKHNNSTRDCKGVNVRNKANGSGTKGSMDGSSNSLKGQNMFNKSLQVNYVTYVSEAYFVQDDDVVWWVNSGATVHVYKDRCWFKTYESLNDWFILHMENDSTALVHGRGCVDLRFSSGKIVLLFNVLHVSNIRKNLVSSSVLNNYGYNKLNIVNDNIGSAFMTTSKLDDSILWHARLGHVHFKIMQDMSKDGLIPTFDMDTEKYALGANGNLKSKVKGAIIWASKKQTCITGSTMEYEFVALAAAGKEAECAATLAKGYSQMYNRKSRHLGVRHSMIRELITNGVISIEFVRSEQNLADHLTKGLAIDLVIKSAEGMGLKSNQLTEAHVLHIIPMMCLEPAEKEDEVANFLMVNFFEKVLCRSMNKEKPPISYQVMGIEVADGVQWVYPLNGVHQRSLVIFSEFTLHVEPSAGILLSELDDSSGH
ncbi:zinc finger, CCHC-type containing protein [Tanacetum coccineum]